MTRFSQYISFFFLLIALSLAGCAEGTGTGYSGNLFGIGNAGVVTNDKQSMPDAAWQTNGQRQQLAAESVHPALQNVKDGQKMRVSILLPLTGKDANLGQSMLKSAQMALFDVGSANFELVPRDTASTTAGAVNAAQKAVADNDNMILGPIFAEHAKAVKPIAQGAHIPMISFTTDWTVAGNGSYVMGFLPFPQVTRVVAYAQAQGMNRFAVFAPQTEYCDVVIQTLQHTRANIVKVGRYSPAQPDLSVIAKDFADQLRTANGFSFDALLLPVGGEGLRTLVSTLDLAKVNNSNTRFIGTGLWDDDSLAQNPSLYGGWFAAPDPALRADFERRYQENYGAAPLRLSTLAYDATAMAAVLARSGDANPYDAAHLTNPRGFAGIDGVFRFRSDGLNERGLAILEVRGGKARVIDRAPTAFISSGT